MEQHHELETMGILRQTKVPATLSWMTESDKSLLLQLHMTGETGLHKGFIKKFEKNHPETVLRITVRDLAEWQSDKHGQPCYLVMTWKGEEVGKLLMQIAKNETRAAARRASAAEAEARA